MSGFEVVGVVLAVAPLIISALENYKAGVHTIQRLYQWESQLLRLILSLKVQHAKFKLNLEKLLRAAAPDQNVQEVPEDYDSVLWQGNVALQVKRYLSTGYEAFRLTVEEYESCVKRLAYKLRHVNRPKSASKDDLRALIDSNIINNGKYSWTKKIDFTMKHKEVTDMISKLDQSNLTLSGFISDSDMLERLQTQSSDKMQSLNVAAKLQSVRMHADSLHKAIATARLPDCVEGHHIALHLEDRLIQATADSGSLKGDVNFDVSVAISVQSIPQWYQTTISVSRPRSVSSLPVDDLCRAIRKAEHLDHSFHLLNNTISKTKLADMPYRVSGDAIITKTLADLIESRTTLTPRDTTVLALKLASSLMQLIATAWLEDYWTKDSITFFQYNENGPCQTSRPCISKTFKNMDSVPSRRSIKPADALFELGVLLMEIGYQRSFESWLEESGFKCIDNSRFARLPYALQWHEESDGLLPIKYRVVIAKCLKCSFDEYDTRWDDPQFRQAVCREIIEPLHQNASIW